LGYFIGDGGGVTVDHVDPFRAHNLGL
jgi:hypothetical protein